MDSEQRDHLISRVVDRCETAADWETLAGLERENEGVWRDLAQGLRCEAELRSVLARELAVADRVELPVVRRDLAARKGNSSLTAWSGWLAAAACLLAWALSSTFEVKPDKVQPRVAHVENTPAATTNPPTSSVIKELPLLIVDTKPVSSGDGYDVVYLRRVLESRRVDHVLELAQDELGGHQPVTVDSARLTRPEVF